MFEKILAVLPYNPGLAGQLAFYSRRMRQEAAIRRTGLVFIVLAFMVQFFAVISPPQSSSAGSSNDLINGGISSAADARANCVRDTQGYQRVMHYFGISCAAFDDAVALTIHSNGQDYYSAGHLPQGARNNNTGRLTNETPFSVDGAGTIYFRKLDSWGTTTYDAYRIRNNEGKAFYVLKSCGNLVSVGIPKQTDIIVPGESTFNLPQTPTPQQPTPQPQPTPTPAQPVITQQPTGGSGTLQQPTGGGGTLQQPCPYNAALPVNSPDCKKPCEYNPSLPADSPQCKPCDKSVSTADAYACIVVRKSAINVTAGSKDANNTTANPGDVITYTLYAENKGKADVKTFSFQETLSDVLDYADVADLHGGTINNEKTVTWPAEAIKAGATATHQVTVKVKAVIPATPTGASDPMHFDLTMTNVYGNAVNIKVPAPLTKNVEVAAAKLPNTGPGSTLAIAAAIVIVAGFFYSRAQLLADESDMALKETASL